MCAEITYEKYTVLNNALGIWWGGDLRRFSINYSASIFQNQFHVADFLQRLFA